MNTKQYSPTNEKPHSQTLDSDSFLNLLPTAMEDNVYKSVCLSVHREDFCLQRAGFLRVGNRLRRGPPLASLLNLEPPVQS